MSHGHLHIDEDQLEKLIRFRGSIFIATDQDNAGHECASALRKALPVGKSVRVTWDAETAKDVGELYAKHGTNFAATLKELCENSQEPSLWKQAPSFASLQEKKFEWIVPDLVPADNVVILTGDFGSFKSYISYFLADAISGGGKFVGRTCRQHRVLILDRENAHQTVYLRKNKIGDLKTCGT